MFEGFVPAKRAENVSCACEDCSKMVPGSSEESPSRLSDGPKSDNIEKCQKQAGSWPQLAPKCPQLPATWPKLDEIGAGGRGKGQNARPRGQIARRLANRPRAFPCMKVFPGCQNRRKLAQIEFKMQFWLPRVAGINPKSSEDDAQPAPIWL